MDHKNPGIIMFFFYASRHLKEKGTEATVLDERDGVILSPNQIAGFCD